MIKILRTDSDHKDFVELVKYLDSELAQRDGEDHSFFAQFNKIDKLKHVVIAYENDLPISCGAMKEYDKNSMEVKRMFTTLENRARGIASMVLAELEKWAYDLSYKKCILETGIRQPEAIRLYEKNGYKLILNYGQYTEVEDSRCFEKLI